MLKKVIPFLLLVFVLVVGYVYRAQIKALFTNDTRSINKVQKTLLIKDELTIVRLAEILAGEGVVKDPKMVTEFAEKNQLQDAELSPGKYLILPQTQLSALVNGFIIDSTGHGSSEQKVNVLFNRCRDIYQMAGNVSKCIQADSSEIVTHITSEVFLKENNVSLDELGALFLPATYQMYFDLNAEEFTDEMMRIRSEFWNEQNEASQNKLGLSKVQVTTLASIVYSEQSKMSEEWPVIAGLYLNRVRKGMLLQSDPTFKFCWGDKLEGVERLTFEHRDIDCPYNTYKYIGLPPGPICLAPAGVVEAVLNAESHDYIFMVAKPGGNGHNFSVTHAQHERYAAEYRRWLKEYLKNKEKN